MQSVNISELATDLLGRYKRANLLSDVFRLIHWRLHSDRRRVWHCHEIFIDAADRFSFRPASRKYFRPTYWKPVQYPSWKRFILLSSRQWFEYPPTATREQFLRRMDLRHFRRYVYDALTQARVCSKSLRFNILSLFIASVTCRGLKRDSKERRHRLRL